MDKLINELCDRTGIDRGTAHKVVGYLQANASRLPELLGLGSSDGGAAKGMANNVAGKVGDVMGRR